VLRLLVAVVVPAVVRTRGRAVAGLDAARRQVWMGSVAGIVVGIMGESVLWPSHWRVLGGRRLY
jgi:hypothetical protein